MKRITREQIQAERVRTPSLAVQRQIAAELAIRMTEAERLTSAIREELAATDALPAALREAARSTPE